MNYTTKGFKQTQKLGERIAFLIISGKYFKKIHDKKAVILALEGDLGSGKTTFLQGFAKGLGVKGKILSPTFIIMKKFKITKTKSQKSKLQNTNKKLKFANFYHIDCYRLKSEKDLLYLGFGEVIDNPQNIIAIEWPERTKKIIPQKAIRIKFKSTGKNSRELVIS